jgi:hypothetical protein
MSIPIRVGNARGQVAKEIAVVLLLEGRYNDFKQFIYAKFLNALGAHN